MQKVLGGGQQAETIVSGTRQHVNERNWSAVVSACLDLVTAIGKVDSGKCSGPFQEWLSTATAVDLNSWRERSSNYPVKCCQHDNSQAKKKPRLKAD